MSSNALALAKPAAETTDALPTEGGPVAVLTAAAAFLTEFNTAADTLGNHGEKAGLRQLCDATAEILRAVAKRVDSD